MVFALDITWEITLLGLGSVLAGVGSFLAGYASLKRANAEAAKVQKSPLMPVATAEPGDETTKEGAPNEVA